MGEHSKKPTQIRTGSPVQTFQLRPPHIDSRLPFLTEAGWVLAPKPQEYLKQIPIYGAIFIDSANVKLAPAERNQRAITLSVNWDKLDRNARDLLHNAKITFAGMYAHRSKTPKTAALAKLRTIWQQKGYTFRHDPKNGADHDMLVDIYDHITRSCLEAKERGERYCIVQHVLMSGDGDFLAVYKRARATQGSFLRLRIFVYSWRPKLNWELLKYVGKKNIRYFEEMPNVFSPRRR